MIGELDMVKSKINFIMNNSNNWVLVQEGIWWILWIKNDVVRGKTKFSKIYFFRNHPEPSSGNPIIEVVRNKISMKVR